MELYLDPVLPKAKRSRSQRSRDTWLNATGEKRARMLAGLEKGYAITHSGKRSSSPRPTLRVPVSVYDLNGHYLMSCQSMIEAAALYGVSYDNLSSCVHGRRKSAGGYMFRKAVVEEFRGVKLVKKTPIEPYKRTYRRKKQDPAIIKDPDMLNFIENYKTNRP